jgi:hypothetical protein
VRVRAKDMIDATRSGDRPLHNSSRTFMGGGVARVDAP